MTEKTTDKSGSAQNQIGRALVGGAPLSSEVRAGFLTSMVRFLKIFGDPWSILLLRDAFLGVRRFDDFYQRIGVNRQTLSRRLSGFVENGILVKEQYQQRPVRFQYRLTDKGRDLYDFALNIWRWQTRWVSVESEFLPSTFYHKTCGNELLPVVICAHCLGELRPEEILVEGVRTSPLDVPKFTPRAKRWVGDKRLKDNVKGFASKGSSVIGDRWSSLVLATVMMGIRSFDEIASELEIASNTLSHRLDVLKEADLLTKPSYNAERRVYLYNVTPAGEDLFPVFLSFSQWADKWLSPEGHPLLRWGHASCGHELTSAIADARCGERVLPTAVSVINTKRPKA